MNVTADMIIEPGMVDSFFTIFGVLVTGLVTGFTVVGLCVYKPHVEEETPYEQKYYEEFDELETRDMTEDEIKGLAEVFIEDETPKGVVKMCYCHDTEGYHYWCDDKSISFITLDAVAQKYAIDNDCKKVCVNYKEEYDKAVERVKEYQEEKARKEAEGDDEKEEEEEEEKKKSVFAKFKSYNTANKEQASDDSEKMSIQVEKANKFRYKGKLEEWSDPKEVKTEEKNEKMSLSDWLRDRKSEDDNKSEENDTIDKDDELKKEK